MRTHLHPGLQFGARVIVSSIGVHTWHGTWVRNCAFRFEPIKFRFLSTLYILNALERSSMYPMFLWTRASWTLESARYEIKPQAPYFGSFDFYCSGKSGACVMAWKV